MERGDLLEMAKEKNEEIKEAFEEYEVLTVAKQEGEEIGIQKGEKI